MSKSQVNPGRGVRGIGRILTVLGIVVLAVGVAVYAAVAAQLDAEKIPINGDTPFMNSVFGSAEGATPKEVKGPLGAIAQSEGIKMHTEKMPGSYGFEDLNGSTAAQIAHVRSTKDYPGAGTEEADAKMTALWNMMNTSSFLRSSLLLSAMAFGVSLLVAGIGLVVLLTGLGLLWVGKQLGDQAPAASRLGASPRGDQGRDDQSQTA
ncbi:MAG: hypothetical protein LBS27_05325 [Bifidobacteriaceae bacterium]|jgi:hypothetical protein|nr:hypothetical protein [Bifidobacteriaceae bacterium]